MQKKKHTLNIDAAVKSRSGVHPIMKKAIQRHRDPIPNYKPLLIIINIIIFCQFLEEENFEKLFFTFTQVPIIQHTYKVIATIVLTQ